jgi:hypothetical protein
MVSSRHVLFASCVLLLAASVACGDVQWTFEITPHSGRAGPGGTIQWDYLITNSSSSTEDLVPAFPGVSFLYPGLEKQFVDEDLLHVEPFVGIGPIPPGQSASGPFYHIRWTPQAPLGYSAAGGMFLIIDNTSASPSVGMYLPFTAEVADTTPPEMDFSLLQDELWPANNKMKQVAHVSGVRDDWDPAPTVDITVTSNESISGPGDPDPDWCVVESGGVWHVWVRATRDQQGSGREYYIDVVVSDSSENQSPASGTVTVPRHRGRGFVGWLSGSGLDLSTLAEWRQTSPSRAPSSTTSDGNRRSLWGSWREGERSSSWTTPPRRRAWGSSFHSLPKLWTPRRRR